MLFYIQYRNKILSHLLWIYFLTNLFYNGLEVGREKSRSLYNFINKMEYTKYHKLCTFIRMHRNSHDFHNLVQYLLLQIFDNVFYEYPQNIC